MQDAAEVFDEVESDTGMQRLWQAYQKKFSYASEISWEEVMQSVRRLYRKLAPFRLGVKHQENDTDV